MRSLDKLLPGIVVEALWLDPLARRPIGVQIIDQDSRTFEKLAILIPSHKAR